MRCILGRTTRLARFALLAALALSISGCAGFHGPLQFYGTPFRVISGSGGGGTTPPGSSGSSGGGGSLGGSDRTPVDPCSEPQSRKFVRISMRNLAPSDHVHYFLVLVAHVNGEEYPDGAVCEEDIALYTSFGYIQIVSGGSREFGNLCINGPALVYFHENGQFRGVGGASGGQLASAIAPSQGTVATYDAFFTSSGAPVPIPNQIIFHNPGSGGGATLKISRNQTDPCSPLAIGGAPNCQQDAFYYVDDRDVLAGSTALGAGSGRRVPDEIQDTGCVLGFPDAAFHVLAPSRVTANDAMLNEFTRGGKIDFVFVRDDVDPPYPQLLWRVTDASGAVVHAFDSRANLP